MTNVLNFYRGLILVEPYGTYIKKHSKTIIVKSKNIKSIVDEDLLLIENKIGIGIIKLDYPKKINLKQFSQLGKYHQISEDERKKWWDKYKYLYVYPIIKTKIFRNPLLLDYSAGPQISITPENISIKKIFIGMSGYYYKDMYPKNTKDLLDYYNQNLNSVEINSTFYRFPPQSTIIKLQNHDLIYSIKVNKYITHNKKMENIDRYWKDFYNIFKPIHHKIYCFLFQFSSKFHCNKENYTRLKKLPKILNKNHYYAFEFRDSSWFENNKVDDLFKKNKWIFVIINVANPEHWTGNLQNGFNPSLKKYKITSDSIYIRMHGSIDKYFGEYHNNDFKQIYDFIAKKPINNSFIYFNNTDDMSAFSDSIKFTKKFNKINLEI